MSERKNHVGLLEMTSYLMLQECTRSSKAENDKQHPYMLDYFNVDLFHPGKMELIKSPFTRLVNNLVVAMNNEHLPRLIFIWPGRSVLDSFNFYSFGMSKIIGTLLTWLVNQFNRIIEDCREKLCAIRPGALIHNEAFVDHSHRQAMQAEMLLDQKQIQRDIRRNSGEAQE